MPGVGWLSLSDQMRKYTFIKLILFLSFLVGGTEVFAKEFRGIIPLHSTRADVKKILGKPLFEEGKPIDIYDVAEGRISIMYIVQPCHQGLPSNWGNWNLPADTVVEISVTLEKPFKFAKLKIPRKQKLKWYTDDTLTTYYHDEEEGVEYSVNRNGFVEEISYGPTLKDNDLLCDRNAPKIKY